MSEHSTASDARLPFLVLDVDGVLQAPMLKYGFEQTRVITEVVPTAQVHPSMWPRRWHGPRSELRRRDHITFRTPVRVSPHLFEDLSALPAQIVMLTTWLEHGSVREFLRQATEGSTWFPDAMLLPFPGRHDAIGSLPYDWKLTALSDLLAADPRPFIWVDDDEVTVWRTEVNRRFPDLPHLLLAPASDTGLARWHVERMRGFLEQL